MEATRADALCDGDFCALLDAFNVPDVGVQNTFYRYILSRQTKEGVRIGTKVQVFARTTCPFRRFTASEIMRSKYPDAQDSSICYAIIFGGTNFWLRMQVDDTEKPVLLVALGEQLLFLDRSGKPDAHAAREVDHYELKFDIARLWLRTCEERHHDLCPVQDLIRLDRIEAPQILRVVDVKECCLTDIRWHDRFAALSYVWGTSNPPKLLRKDLRQFSTPGSLKELQYSFPKTIQDAMVLTIGLGLRYLWFDSLCLLQDSPDDLKLGISNMDLVYESACITFVAANGAGADTGLPGVNSTPRAKHQDITVLKPGLEIVRTYSLDHHLNQSVWASRGWTLQEHYLSRRTLNFVNGQAIFRCRQRIWSEEHWSDRDPEVHNTEQWITNLVALAQESMDREESVAAPHEFLFRAIDRFQLRNLTDEGDAINAMTGILQRVAHRAKTRMYFGLPCDLFPVALCFLHFRRKTPIRRPEFPSWSWSGWKAQPTWYSFDAIEHESNPEEIGETLDGTLVFIDGIEFSSSKMEQQTLWQPLHKILEDAFESAVSFNKAIIRERSFQHNSHLIPGTKAILSITGVIIYLKTKHTAVRADNAALTNRISALHGKDCYECGYLYRDTEEYEETNEPLIFLILSRCYRTEYPIQKIPLVTATSRELLWVLFVVPGMNGLYERRGIGHIPKSCVTQSFSPGPQWQQILLA